jgi:hypothetical protein
MRFVTIYLAVYFLLLVGAGDALWRAGVLAEIPAMWLGIAAIVAVGFGIMLAVASSPRTVTTSQDVE